MTHRRQTESLPGTNLHAMPVYIVQPFCGVGPVRFGMSPEEVRRSMPEPSTPFRKETTSQHEIDAFHDCAFQVFYGGVKPTVEYIELSRGSVVQPLYRGLDVFATPSEEVVAFIARDGAFDATDWEMPYSYVFRALQLSLWRPVIPDSDSDNEGRYFSTIGIGKPGYYELD